MLYEVITVSLSNVLNGKTSPGTDVLAKMISALRSHQVTVDTDYLLGVKDVDESSKIEEFRQQRERLLKPSSSRVNPQKSEQLKMALTA